VIVRKCFRVVVVVVAYTFLSAGVCWADARPLPSDPRILTGTLDNGVRWMYRRHDNPPGKMAFMMHVRAGSLDETDAQRGLAHFMEHMVFNGTEHFKSGELIPFCERMGMKFGEDLNASTSFDRTAFMLYTPKADLEQIDKALMILSDDVFRALLDEAEINKERGVILEETRSRKSAEQRIRDTLWPELYVGSRFAKRLPIGDPEVVAHAPRSEFVDFYRTWYRPENITLIIVGDADPKPVIPLIRKWFGGYKADRPARKAPLAEVKPFVSQRAFVITDPEITTCKVQMLNILPGRPAATTVEQWRTEFVEGIADRIVSRRFDDRVKKGQASYRSAGTGMGRFFNDEALMVNGSAAGEPADWAKMLEQLILEMSRAREYGFTNREMTLIRKEVLASAERAVRTEPTRNARAMIREVFDAVDEGVPVPSAQQELDLVREVLPSVTAAEVSETFRKRFAPGPFAYVILMPEKEGVAVPARDDVLAAARAAWARRVEPPASDETAQDVLPSLPPSGKLAEISLDKDLGVTSGWLDNGIRVHHRFMDYKKDSVMVTISFAGGGIEETPANLGVTSLAGLVFSNPATSRLGSTEIRDLMVGKSIRVGGGSSADDAFVVQIAGSPRDLEAGLKLAYALITDGRIEETGFKNWRTAALREIERNETNVSFKAGEALSDLLSGGDPRRLPVSKKNIEALTIPQAQAWLARLCREAPVEVAVVGDMQWNDVRPLIERYIGSLPKRSRSAAHLDPLRRLSRKTGPLSRRVKVETITPAAMVYAGFVGCEGRNADDRRALHLAANVLTSRLLTRIREDLSLVYGIGAESSPSWIYRDAGRFSSGAKCKRENAEQVVDEVRKAFQEFAASGPTAEELAAAKKQVLNKLDTDMKEPVFWLDFLEHLDLRGRSLEDAKVARAKYQTITAEQVQAAFAKYDKPERSFAVTAVPVSPQTRPATTTRPAPKTKEPATVTR
jgi:zinc protease